MIQYLSWHTTITGRRVATKVAKAFVSHGLEMRVEQLMDRAGDEMPRPSNRFMILVHNPGEPFEVFNAKCNKIVEQTIN